MYRENCWDCNDFYIGKTKRRLRDRKTEHFKALTTNCHESAIADHVFLTNHRIKWVHYIRNVKFIKVMQLKQMFVTAVCVLFLLKLSKMAQVKEFFG